MLVHNSRSPGARPRLARRLLAGTAALASALALPQAAQGAVGVIQSPIKWVSPTPADVTPNALVDADEISMFIERSQVTLQSPLAVDAATPGLYDGIFDLPLVNPQIAAGTVVDSYMVHADVPLDPLTGLDLSNTLKGTITFSPDTPILGVMVTSATLVASDPQVGSTSSLYLLGPLGRRGVEYPDLNGGKDVVEWVDLHTIKVTFDINTVVDEVRIITASAKAETPGTPPPPPLPVEIPTGYRFVASDGGVFSFGNRGFYGSTGAMKLNQPIVVGSETSTARGYWLIARDGGVFSFGDARFHGSTGAMTLNQPIVAMAATPDDGGYWLFAADGGVFTFGNAIFKGSAPSSKTVLGAPVVAAAATPDGGGYWVATTDGRVLNYGNAGFYGSAASVKLSQPIVAMTPTGSGKGYWLLGRDGGIFSFGDASFHGSTGAMKLNQPVVAMQPTPTGQGYWLVATDGGVFSFGDARFHGSTGAIKLARPIVGVL